jgi:hypothetical protein
VLRAGEKFDGVVAPAVVKSLQRTPARQTNADGRLRVSASQGLTFALPVVPGDVTIMLMAHFGSFLAASTFSVPPAAITAGRIFFRL